MEILINAQQAAEFMQPCTSLLAGCCGTCNLAAQGGSAHQSLARCALSFHQSRTVPVLKEWLWCLS